MFTVVCYDIADDRRRYRAARELEGWGWRVQESVFECHLNPQDLAELKHRLAGLIDPQQDKVRYYPLCQKDRQDIELFGHGEFNADIAWWLIG